MKKTFNILFVGDVFSTPGLKVLESQLMNVIYKYDIDFTIVNAENSSNNGRGISKKAYRILSKELKVDAITMGNHSFKNRDITKILGVKNNLVLPSNLLDPYDENYRPIGTKLFVKNSKKIRVSQVMGNSFISPVPFENCYTSFEDILEKNKDEKDVIHIVDLHAETTSEKVCFAYKYDGIVTSIIGTHTHVQTSDERILHKGTSFITDVGMTGVQNSAIGVNFDDVIDKYLNPDERIRFKPAFGESFLSAVVIKLDELNNNKEIFRIFISENKL